MHIDDLDRGPGEESLNSAPAAEAEGPTDLVARLERAREACVVPADGPDRIAVLDAIERAQAGDWDALLQAHLRQLSELDAFVCWKGLTQSSLRVLAGFEQNLEAVCAHMPRERKAMGEHFGLRAEALVPMLRQRDRASTAPPHKRLALLEGVEAVLSRLHARGATVPPDLCAAFVLADPHETREVFPDLGQVQADLASFTSGAPQEGVRRRFAETWLASQGEAREWLELRGRRAARDRSFSMEKDAVLEAFAVTRVRPDQRTDLVRDAAEWHREMAVALRALERAGEADMHQARATALFRRLLPARRATEEEIAALPEARLSVLDR